MNKKIILACLAIVIASPLPALASFYGGGSIGTGWYGADVQVNNVVESFSENATAWKVFVGLSSEAFLCVEGGYRNLGSTNTTFDGEYVSFGTSAWDLEMLGRVKLGPVYVFGKIGGITSKTETSYGTGDEKKTGLIYGLGASFALESIGIRAEWEYLDVDVPDSLSMGSLGLTFGF